MFSFVIHQFLDDDEEEILSKASSPAFEALKVTLRDIADQLNASIDALVKNCGPIRSRIEEIQDQLPDDILDALTLAAYLESRRSHVHRA